MVNTELEITRQHAQLEIETHRARVDIATRRPKFVMKRSIPSMRLERRLPTMRVDRTPQMMTLNIGPALRSNLQYYQSALQDSIAAIGDISADGTAMMQIENGQNIIADIGARSAMDQEGDLNLSSMPPPEINWDPGVFAINWTPGMMEMQWDVSTWADIRVEPHYVEIRLKKYPEIKITVKVKQKNEDGKIVDKYI